MRRATEKEDRPFQGRSTAHPESVISHPFILFSTFCSPRTKFIHLILESTRDIGCMISSIPSSLSISSSMSEPFGAATGA